MLRISILMLFFCFSCYPLIYGETLVDRVIRDADNIMIGKTAKYMSVMTIARPGVADVVAKYQTYFRGRGEKVMLRMLYPPKEVGKDLLLIKDNMWQYVPKIERSVRVAGSQRFLGGDFNNADLLKVSLVNDYSGKLVGKNTFNGVEYYHLTLTKKRPQATYDRVEYWVRKKDKMPFREVYYTRSGKKMKTLQYEDVGSIGNRIRPRRLVMINALRPTHRTIINIVKAEYGLELSESLFTRTYLERKRR